MLAHQDDFDVRWCKGTIAEEIFAPWKREIEKVGGEVFGGRRVARVELATGESNKRRSRVVATTRDGDVVEEETHEADVVVMATGVGAARGIIASSPDLRDAAGLRGFLADPDPDSDDPDSSGIPSTSVIAVRLFLDVAVTLPCKSNVWGGFTLGASRGSKNGGVEGVTDTVGTEDVAGTFFDLCALHDEYRDLKKSSSDASDDVRSVIEVDMYNAGSVIDLDDETLVEMALRDILTACVRDVAPEIQDAVVVDSSVLRFKDGVTKFAPGSAVALPRTTPAGLERAMFYVAGDHVWQGPGSHGARGLSQEKALVSGMAAADAAAAAFGRIAGEESRRATSTTTTRAPARILDVEPDEPHVAAAKDALRAADALEAFLPRPPPGFPPLF